MNQASILLKRTFVGSLAWFLVFGVSHSKAGPVNDEFSYRLFHQVSKSIDVEENFVFSPYVARSALALAALGARGKTQRQLSKAPDAWVQKKDTYKWMSANRLWVDMKFPLLETFLASSTKAFGDPPWMVDYSKAPDFLADRINGWVSERTSGKIKNMISEESIDLKTKMTLTSAAYFKGDWAFPFQLVEGPDEKFKTSKGETSAAFLRRAGRFLYTKRRDFQILEIPFTGEEVSLVLLLPQSPGILSALEAQLNQENMSRWMEGLSLTDVVITLPRLQIDSSIELSESLKGAGVVDPFSPDDADFSGMTGTRSLHLNRMVQKVTLSLHDEGVEATSGSVSRALASSIASQSFLGEAFNAKHPFIMILRNRVTSSLIFMGRVANPETLVVRKSAP